MNLKVKIQNDNEENECIGIHFQFSKHADEAEKQTCSFNAPYFQSKC